MVEQLGLDDPVRYNWTLHDRLHATGPGIPPCPAGMEYLVVQRNFDFISSPLNQLQYSPYVNDTLYSYLIEEFCTGPNPLAETIPSPVDPPGGHLFAGRFAYDRWLDVWHFLHGPDAR